MSAGSLPLRPRRKKPRSRGWQGLARGLTSSVSTTDQTVTLTDLCNAASVTPARFVSATARGCCQMGQSCVLLALQQMELPKDIEAAVSEFFVLA